MRFIEDKLEELDGYFASKKENEKWLIIVGIAGIIALGGLVSGTLLVAMLSNLILLPSLLLSLESKIQNKKVFKERSVDILPKEE